MLRLARFFLYFIRNLTLAHDWSDRYNRLLTAAAFYVFDSYWTHIGLILAGFTGAVALHWAVVQYVEEMDHVMVQGVRNLV